LVHVSACPWDPDWHVIARFGSANSYSAARAERVESMLVDGRSCGHAGMRCDAMDAPPGSKREDVDRESGRRVERRGDRTGSVKRKRTGYGALRIKRDGKAKIECKKVEAEAPEPPPQSAAAEGPRTWGQALVSCASGRGVRF
jgi:hypothetical protein